jgi:hypothetical protein
MTIEEILKKATEGGYKYKDIFIFNKIVKDVLHFSSESGDRMYILEFASVFMDKNFWQALGKVMEWASLAVDNSTVHRKSKNWVEQWHFFIDHLAVDQKPEDYFKSLK